MVSFIPSGRMGNFLFEAATAISYSLKHGLTFSTPLETNNNFWNPIYLQHLQNAGYDKNLETISIPERGHEYQEIPFEEYWRNKNILIDGYRQSEKYFKEHRDEILTLFQFPYEKKEGCVSVHVRRGDYLQLEFKHPKVTKEWYEEAVGKFPGYQFKFFSDDISWCKQEFGSRGDCEFSTNTNETDDLVEMANCEHNICSASTFAWWGMWLNRNENKKVIFPKLWFVEGFGGLNTDDILPEWVEKL